MFNSSCIQRHTVNDLIYPPNRVFGLSLARVSRLTTTYRPSVQLKPVLKNHRRHDVRCAIMDQYFLHLHYWPWTHCLYNKSIMFTIDCHSYNLRLGDASSIRWIKGMIWRFQEPNTWNMVLFDIFVTHKPICGHWFLGRPRSLNRLIPTMKVYLQETNQWSPNFRSRISLN